jgi:hypothetical protein
MMDIGAIFAWVRSRIELSSILSILTGAVTYVGHCYYGSYYDFYSIPSESIKIPLSESIIVSVGVGVFSLALIGMVYRSQTVGLGGFWGVVSDNVPLFVIFLLVTIVAVDIYWSNVESASSWLSSLVPSRSMLAQNEVLTARVETFLRLMIVLAPVPVALVLVGLVSAFGYSFSHSVMEASSSARIGVLCLYLLLLLRVCCIWGRATAFSEFAGLLAKPEVVVTLEDGKIFQPAETLFVVAVSDSELYFCGKSSGRDSPVDSWIVPLQSVKFMQAKPGATRWDVLLKYFKGQRPIGASS